MSSDPIVALLLIAALIAASAFFSISELAVAASRRVRLRQLADQGEWRAQRVLAVQDDPGDFFTAIQIGMNTVAILGGVVGEGAFSPLATRVLTALRLDAAYIETSASALSFVLVTSLFILLADLAPKRLGMVAPEQVALRVVGPMLLVLSAFRPLVWCFKRLTDMLFKLFGLPDRRDEAVTSDDILAMAQAGTDAGVLAPTGQQVIENVFELDTRLVTSAMTPRDRIVHLLLDDSEALIRARIEQFPHSTYLVCDGNIDHVVGYGPYLDRVPQRPGLTRHASGNTVEVDRARAALMLALRGERVAVVSGGDAGVFGMAAAVFEAAEDPVFAGVAIRVLPGVSAIQAVAARAGAPIGADFAVMSLSDRLKPWSAIEQRLRAVSEADLVLGLYNPASRTRVEQLARAKDVLLEHRKPDTVVVIGRDVGRAEESLTVTTLAELDTDAVDMKCLLIIGASSTRLGPAGVWTPRYVEAAR